MRGATPTGHAHKHPRPGGRARRAAGDRLAVIKAVKLRASPTPLHPMSSPPHRENWLSAETLEVKQTSPGMDLSGVPRVTIWDGGLEMIAATAR